MSMTDPVADFLTRIRNALVVRKSEVRHPKSALKVGIADALKREGFIADYRTEGEGKDAVLTVELKYGPDGEYVIRRIERVSKPGRRIYTSIEDFKPVLGGMGVGVLSTNKGILSDREARKQNVGGEVLCRVW